MNRCEVLRKANTKDKHMLGNINKGNVKSKNQTIPYKIKLLRKLDKRIKELRM